MMKIINDIATIVPVVAPAVGEAVVVDVMVTLGDGVTTGTHEVGSDSCTRSLQSRSTGMRS